MKLTPLLSAALGLLLGFTGTTPAKAAPTPIAIAAAADLRGVLEELKTTYEGKHPDVQLQISYGASGSITAQVQQGAPYDIFLAADTGFPETLQKGGLVTDDGVFPYATGRLTLWVRKDLNLDPAKDGLKVLLQPSVKKVSTANPKTAPYGRAGEAALRSAGLYDAVQPSSSRPGPPKPASSPSPRPATLSCSSPGWPGWFPPTPTQPCARPA